MTTLPKKKGCHWHRLQRFIQQGSPQWIGKNSKNLLCLDIQPFCLFLWAAGWMVVPFNEMQNTREGWACVGGSQEFFCGDVKFERLTMPLDSKDGSWREGLEIEFWELSVYREFLTLWNWMTCSRKGGGEEKRSRTGPKGLPTFRGQEKDES